MPVNVIQTPQKACEIVYGRSSSTAAAVRQCKRQLRTRDAQLLLVFCGGKHQPAHAFAALQNAFPDVPIVGGAAAGAICRDGCGYSGLEIAVMAFLDPFSTPEIFVNYDLLNGEFEAGRQLGAELASAAADNSLVVLFYDSIANTSPLRLHPASTIVAGIQASLGNKRVQLIGGGLLTNLNLTDGWIFDGAGPRKHAILALVFPVAVTAHTSVLHGCRPVSTFMQITRIEGAEVFELDGRPALTVIEDMLQLSVGREDRNGLTLAATLGQKQGDPWASFDEDAYVNRLILSGNPDTGSITLFEPDFAEGAAVQIMARDNDLMLDSVRSGVGRANDSLREGNGLFALYIDCAGRASARSGSPVEEADLVRAGLDPRIPLMGFYSGVEIASYRGRPRPLDWSGVLTVARRAP